MDVQSLRKHIEAKIEASTIEMSPFPHLVIENFFPDDVYTQILARNPFVRNKGVEWMSKEAPQKGSDRTPYHARKQINFHKDQEFQAEADDKAFWDVIKTTFLQDHWFEQLTIRKFPDFFSIRFGDEIKDEKFLDGLYKELFLQRHEVGYHIGPHTDIPTRIFTCIFSFAEREGFEEYGTELLKPKDKTARCWGNDHYPPGDFDVVKIAPYKPNNFLMFFKTRHSFHAVKAITPDVPAERYGMQFQMYEPLVGIFKDLSVPDLMKPKHKETESQKWERRIKTLVGAK